MATVALAAAPSWADSYDTDFEAPLFTTGSPNGQDGWTNTNQAFDHEIDESNGTEGFDEQSLRISNAVTSGSFGDQTFSEDTADEAGEINSEGDGAQGTLQNRYEATFDIASAVPDAPQTGLVAQVSPDRGDGARMSFVGFEDLAGGLQVFFNDYQALESQACDTDTDPNTGFVRTNVATGLDRTETYTVTITMDFVDGRSNDVVTVTVEDSAGEVVGEHTGTSWEDYFRDCENTSTRSVDSLGFFTRGTAVPANSGNGFLFDNLSITTSNADRPLIVDEDGLADIGANGEPLCDANVAAFSSIQAAINAAADNDTVLVCPGTYSERPVVDKPLTLEGAQAGIDPTETAPPAGEQSIVGNGDSSNVIFAITADDVTLDGFTVQPTGTTSTGVVGIQPSGDEYEIANNIVTNNTIGLYPGGTDGIIVSNSIVGNNRAGGVSGNGIYTDTGPTGLTVNSNEFENHNNTSMNFASTANTTNTDLEITFNEISDNRILLTKTVDSTVENNTITNSRLSGIQIDFNNQGLDVTGNTITGSGVSNTSALFPAIRLTSVNDTTAPASEDIVITGNNLLDNELGIQVQADNKTPDDGILAAFNRIFGNDTAGLQNNSTFDVNAINNWWGCNEGPNEDGGCDSVDDTTTGVTDFDPWLEMDITADPTNVTTGGDSAITVSFDQNSDEDEVTPAFPNGVTVDFTATGGTVNPTSDETEFDATAETIFTAGQNDGDASVTGSLDAEDVTVDLTVRGEGNEDCDIVGTPGNDTLTGTNGDDVICGLGGNDTINGGGGNDELRGGDGNDRLSGQNGNDILDGGDGDDRADGGGGNDTITGGSGEDNLRGQDGNDTINGGANDDTIFGGAGQDTLNGAGGNDNVSGDNADDTVLGGAGDDILKGGTGTDRITGNTGNDILLSGTGMNDQLNGGDGDDRLNVRDGTGRDRADGGAGRDTCASDRGDTVRNCEVNNSRSAPLQK